MKIALLGDIALIGRYDCTSDEHVSERIKFIKELVKDCDFVIANMESVLTDKTNTFACKGVYLRSATKNVKTLLEMGVTHVTIANNHVYDYGIRGANDMMEVLNKAGIKYVGLCNSAEILRKDDAAVMLDGFCCLSANALRYGNTLGSVQLLTPDAIKKYLEKAKKENCFPIVSVHYGIEGVHYPATEHISLFRELADQYDYVLHGNHPHVMQGYEKYKNSLLIYAQGNLCFDNCEITSFHQINKETEESRKGYVTILEIKGNKIIDFETIPVTDVPNGILKENIEGKKELEIYCEALNESIENIEKLRKEELARQKENATKHDFKFFLNRLNRKYIGAYLNGIKHAKSYKKIMLNRQGD